MCCCASGGSWWVPRQPVSRFDCGWRVGLFLGDLALVDQALHVGVVDRAAHHLGAAEVVDARVAGVDDVALAVRADQERGDRAVRLFLGGDRGQLDHQVRFEHQLLQRLGGVVAARRIALEELLRGQDHLVGGLAAAALAAHAVGQHAHARSPGTRPCGMICDLVLLVGAVAAVHAGGRGQAVAQASRCSWAKTIIGLILLPKSRKPRH